MAMASINATRKSTRRVETSVSMRDRQRAQHEHDLKNHFDILSLSRQDRLKHYGLHFAKYAGRFARGTSEVKTRRETLVDAFLVVLSAANALNQALADLEHDSPVAEVPTDLAFTDHAGRFADACEKIDHLEEFRAIALAANAGLSEWLFCSAAAVGLDLDALIDERRQQLARRQVFAQEK
ncbi:hypothetical protein [Neorhizobium sp. DAR64862/K0K3]|uniref:hypothetical protein n=1 Tax=Neorhizobium sp. DAR64862/K0K3 TaxID=3421957 RepID=UPI003D2B25D7